MNKIKKKKIKYISDYTKILKNYKFKIHKINIKKKLYEDEYLIKKKKIKIIKYNNESKIILNKSNLNNNFNFIYSINKIYKSPFFLKTEISYKNNFLNKDLLNYFYFLIFIKLYKKKHNINFIEGRFLSLSKKKKIIVYSLGKIYSMKINQLIDIKKKKYKFFRLMKKIHPFFFRKYYFKIFNKDKFFEKVKISRKAYVNDVQKLFESLKKKKGDFKY